MNPYTSQDIKNIYCDIVKSAKKNYSKKRYSDVIKDVDTAAGWAYSFNHIYTDPDTESLVKSVAEATIQKVEIELPNSDKCVLIDSFLLDNRGLSQQYLRAMMANNMEILVVYTNAGGSVGKDTLNEIQGYAKASILTFAKDIDFFEQTRRVVKKIVEFMPAHIFLHLTPWDVVALMACYTIKGAKIYNINLTDHAFWMGASFINYNLEFRPYGRTVSLEKRGLKSEQLIGLPFYPISPKNSEFMGLPEIPVSAVKVFTGGALYKMLGKNDIFFRIMDCVLSVSSDVYIMVAGFNQDKRFDEKCAAMKHGDRVIQIGVRRDIDEVFKRCDIYLGTYPMTGGLMSQYAAKHCKPIIAYHDEGDTMNMVEEFVDFYGSGFKSFSDLKEMKVYASKLVKDAYFRENQGKRLYDGMMNEERFRQEFSSLISLEKTSFSWEKDNIDYDDFFERYLDLENNNGFMATLAVLSKQRAATFRKLKGYKLQMLSGMFQIINGRLSRLLWPHNIRQKLFKKV